MLTAGFSFHGSTSSWMLHFAGPPPPAIAHLLDFRVQVLDGAAVIIFNLPSQPFDLSYCGTR